MSLIPDSAWPQVREAVLKRDRDCLLAFRRGCFGEHDPHHIWRRGVGGPDELWNLKRLCRAHHRWVHEHVLLAQSFGLLVPSWIGEPGAKLSDVLVGGVRVGRPRFAPWLSEDEVLETIRQDTRFAGATVLPMDIRP